MIREGYSIQITGNVMNKTYTVDEMADTIVSYSNKVLADSLFFKDLAGGVISVADLRYIFMQYEYWRNIFHEWFGLCILKSGDASHPYVSHTVQALAHHVMVEMKENHTLMYQRFIEQLGHSTEPREPESHATRKYKSHFLNVFGTSDTNFVESVAALSARELFASIRNTYVKKALKAYYGIDKSPWWDIHEHLELEHFQDTFTPLKQELEGKKRYVTLMRFMTNEIDAHVQYWDELYQEAQMISCTSQQQKMAS
ncbi:hypothetical protein B9G39_08075 [Zooshikella ganghwensis]|uniref:Iron-containing redox enzyme family protein n=2 Tax=Zooshikella ganghwensis TaxID=202772 RepID=A0A4P9VJF0_9GAMM|nr:hypothetical protein B9G39_08075 [Zooshikella ganghwensis]